MKKFPPVSLFPAILQAFLALGNASAGTTKTPGTVRFALFQTPAVETVDEARTDELFGWVGDRLAGDEDAVVLPEYAFTSFSEFPGAWRQASNVWRKAAAFAAERDVWLFVNHPFRESDDGNAPLFNETRVFSPDGGVAAVYRKRILANMDRAAGFSPGGETVVADLPFGRVGLLTCKDSRYPENGGSGYATADLLLVQFAQPGVDDGNAPEAAAFPGSAEARGDMRGIRFGWCALNVPFLAVNKTGRDGNYVLCGGTFASDSGGNVFASAETDAAVVIADLPLAADGRLAPPPPFTISLDASGGTISRTGVIVARGDPIGALPAPARKGYEFRGWFTARSGGSKVSPSTMPFGDATLCARWAATTYKIAFKACGGRLPKGKTMPAQTMVYGKAAKLRKNVYARTGFVFAGWAKKKGGPVVYANAQRVGNLRADGKTATLYAVWAKKTYKVAFLANGGKGGMDARSFAYGKAKRLPANAFKAPKGRKFAGWATSAAKAKAGKVAYRNKALVKNLSTTGKTVKLYAVWKK